MQLPIGSAFGKIKNVPESVLFYQHWANYLTPINGVLSFVVSLGGALIKVMYYVTSGLEDIFYTMFGLFGMFSSIGSRDNIIGEFYYWFQILGISLFMMLLVIQTLAGFLSKPLKYKEAIKHVTLVLLVISVLPSAMNKIGSVAESSVKDAQTLKTSADDESVTKIALQPLKSNTIDLMVLNENKWGIDNPNMYPMDKNKFLKPNVEMKYKNNITAESIPSLNLGATLGAMDTELLDKLDKESANPESKVLFLHYLNSSEDDLVAVSEHRINESFNALENVYLRYRVNFFGVFLQYIALMIILISLSIKTTKSIFEIIVTIVVAPIVGFSSTQSSKKFKELLRSITGGITSIFLEVIVLRIMLYVMTYVSVSSIFSNLNMMSQAIAIFIVYIGCFYGAFSGINAIERFTGVSQGHSDTLQQMIGTGMVAGAMADGLSSGVNTVTGVGKGVASTFGGVKEAFSTKDIPPNNDSDSSGGIGKNIDDTLNQSNSNNDNSGGLNMDGSSEENENSQHNNNESQDDVTNNADNYDNADNNYENYNDNDDDHHSNQETQNNEAENIDNNLTSDLTSENNLDADINNENHKLDDNNSENNLTGLGLDEDKVTTGTSGTENNSQNLDSSGENGIKGIGELEKESGFNFDDVNMSNSGGLNDGSLSNNDDSSQSQESLTGSNNSNISSNGLGFDVKDHSDNNISSQDSPYTNTTGGFNFESNNTDDHNQNNLNFNQRYDNSDRNFSYQTKFNESSMTNDNLTSFQRAKMDLKSSNQKLQTGSQQITNASYRSTLNADNLSDDEE